MHVEVHEQEGKENYEYIIQQMTPYWHSLGWQNALWNMFWKRKEKLEPYRKILTHLNDDVICLDYSNGNTLPVPHDSTHGN